jgi:hypothetical protein
MKKTLATIALIGAAGAVQAAPATLTGVTSYSPNGAAVWVISGASTWDVNTGTGVATQTGSLSMKTSVGKAVLMTHTFSGAVLSSGAATGSAWNCIPGSFLSVVNVCGNYNYGPNLTDDSTYTAGVASSSVVLGGDDFYAAGGAALTQSMANQYSGLALTNLGGGNWKLSNGVVGVGGYDFVFNVVPVPAAVWLFGSALGLMGVARRRAAV